MLAAAHHWRKISKMERYMQCLDRNKLEVGNGRLVGFFDANSSQACQPIRERKLSSDSHIDSDADLRRYEALLEMSDLRLLAKPTAMVISPPELPTGRERAHYPPRSASA